MKSKFNSYTPFLQASLLFIIGVVAFTIFSIVFSLIIDWKYPEILGASIEQQYSQYAIQFMIINFLPIQLGLMLTPGLLYLYLARGQTRVILKPKLKFVIWSVLLFLSVFFLLPFLSDINVAITKWFGAYEGLVRQKQMSDQMLTTVIGEVGSTTFYFSILTIGVVTGIAEELAFRRFLFHHMLTNTRKLGLSLISSSVIFALLHFNYIQMLPLFTFGMVLALMYYASGSIIPGIVAHAANNIINVYWLATGTFPYWLEEIELKITIPSTILLMGLLIYFFRKK